MTESVSAQAFQKLPEAQEPQGYIKKNSVQKLTILILGKSTVAGVGVEKQKEGFSGTFAKALANEINTTVSWKVNAKSGYTAKQVREKLIIKPNITKNG